MSTSKWANTVLMTLTEIRNLYQQSPDKPVDDLRIEACEKVTESRGLKKGSTTVDAHLACYPCRIPRALFDKLLEGYPSNNRKSRRSRRRIPTTALDDWLKFWLHRSDSRKLRELYLNNVGRDEQDRDLLKNFFDGKVGNKPIAESPKKRTLKAVEREKRNFLADEEALEDAADDGAAYSPSAEDHRELVNREICQRRGQSRFRDALLKRYKGRCLVTGCEVLAVLEAAHIRPYLGEKDNHPTNGLLLRADIHTLFDLDLLGIKPDSWAVELHPKVAKAKEYNGLAGARLKCPGNSRPSLDALESRYERFCQRLNLKGGFPSEVQQG